MHWGDVSSWAAVSVSVLVLIRAIISERRAKASADRADEKRDEAVGAAIKVASATNRLADLHASRMTAEESAQAYSVAIVEAPIKGGRSGWHVQNDSDQPITEVGVSTTTGAKIQVYNNDLKQFAEYRERTLSAGAHSQLPFRPADTQAVRLDPAECDRMVLRFTDARGQRWERTGTHSAQRIDP